MHDVPPARVLCADAQETFRNGCGAVLAAASDFEWVGGAATTAEAYDLARTAEPDLLLVDLFLPPDGCLPLLERLAALPRPPKPVVLAEDDAEAEAVATVRFGARGVLSRAVAIEVLIKCLRHVRDGEYWLRRVQVGQVLEAYRSLARVMAPPPPRRVQALTPRERVIIVEIASGASNRQIAERFNVSRQTVKNQLTSIFVKLGIANRVELAVYARQNGLDDSSRSPS